MVDELGQQLFGDNVILVTANIADHRSDLHPSELAIIAGAIEKRALEFSTGRYCAHQALQALGIENFPVLRGEQREPVWPDNVVGSISHCPDIAGAVVVKKQHVRSVGFDIEHHKQLNPDIARHICTPEEKDWVRQKAPTQKNLLLLLIFSLKEAVFKCVYQATGISLGFKQCQIHPNLLEGESSASIIVDGITSSNEDIFLQFHINEIHIFSLASWNHHADQ